MPIAVADVPAAEHADVESENLKMVAASVTAFPASLNPVARALKFAEVEKGHTCKMVSLGQKLGISASLRQRDHLFDEACGPPEVATDRINIGEAS